MRSRSITARNTAGFTLAEITIALLIIGVLIGGLLPPLWRQLESSRVRETQRAMDSIRDALIGFAVANGRLPCPAVAATPNGGTSGAGIPAGMEEITKASPPNTPPTANLTCTTNNGGVSSGVVPWITLGVSETDAWGRRFSYIVTSAFADDGWCASTIPFGQGSSFCTNAQGNLSIAMRATAPGAAAALPQTVVAAVVISHGRNGYRGFRSSGVQDPNGPGTSDENGNAVPTANTLFVSRDLLPIDANAGCNDTGGGPLCEFDDLVIGVDAPRLVGRLVSAGRLP